MPRKKYRMTAQQKAAEERLSMVLKRALLYILTERQADAAVKSINQHMGGFSATLRASEDALAKVPDVGPETAKFLRLCIDLAKAYMECSSSMMRFITDSRSAEELFRPLFLDKAEEHVAMALLGSDCQLLYCGIVGSGGLSSAPLNTREILRMALNYEARYALLAHNHLSGIVMPSDDDVVSTAILFSAFNSLGISLRDHIILTKDSMFSFSDSDVLNLLFEEDKAKRRSLIDDALRLAKYKDTELEYEDEYEYDDEDYEDSEDDED